MIEHPQSNNSPTVEFGELLRQYRLGLALIAGAGDHVASLPVQWVHASELEDPTPFLPPRTVLLTTGARASAFRGQDAADAYVARLIAVGTTALGFAVGLHWERVPRRLVSACDRLGLPLFRVPYDTAFITIVRAAADLINAQIRDRDTWALESQRAVTAASLRRNGLEQAVKEAAGRLGGWVCIADRSGRVIEFAPETARGEANIERVRHEVRNLVERGMSAGRIGAGEHSGMRLQALGRRGQVLGVLVVEDRGVPDNAERALIGLLAALATAQLEHRGGLDQAQATLRAGIIELLLAGNTPLASRLAETSLSRIPRDPIALVRYSDPTIHSHGFLQDLHSLDAGSDGLLLADHEGAPLIVTETRHLPALRRLLASHSAPAGISERGTRHDLGALLTQADRAHEVAVAAGSTIPVDYTPSLHDGLLRLLVADPEAQLRAATLLAPVRQHDARHNDEIERSLHVWLAHHGQTSPAATELGVHRHTLSARVQTAARLLQADFDSPDTRAELWAAMRLAEPTGTAAPADTTATR